MRTSQILFEQPNSLDLMFRHEQPNSLDLMFRHEQPNSLDLMFRTARSARDALC
jgi:hypothetical protein